MRNWPRPTRPPFKAYSPRSPSGTLGRDLRHPIPEHRSVISSSPCRPCYRQSTIRRALLLRRGWHRCQTRPSALLQRRMAFFPKRPTGEELMRVNCRFRWLMWSCLFTRSLCFHQRTLVVLSSSGSFSSGVVMISACFPDILCLTLGASGAVEDSSRAFA